jgi:hypothetical protein
MAASSTPIIVHLFFMNFILNPQAVSPQRGLCRIRPGCGAGSVKCW